MRAWQRADNDIVAPTHLHLRSHGTIGDNRPVRLHCALRVSRRPGRIANGRQALALDIDRRQRLLCGVQQGIKGHYAIRRLVRDRNCEPDFVQHSVDPVQLIFRGDDCAGLAIIDNIFDLAWRQHGVDRVDDRTGPRDGVVGYDPLPRVTGIECNDIPFCHTRRRNSGCSTFYQIVQFIETERLSLEDKRWLLTKKLRRAACGQPKMRNVSHVSFLCGMRTNTELNATSKA